MLLKLVCIFCLTTFVFSNKLEGRVHLPNDDSIFATKVLLDDGKYRGYLKSDGTFSVYNVPSGSYVVQIVNPVYYFEPVRVDISSRGSVRARKLNHLKPSSVSILKYPFELKPVGMTRYFQVREKFSVLDMLKSPMVLMMVLPMLILFILPKMMNASDPETRREMENSMNMFSQNSSQMPDMAEMVSNWFGGSKKKAITSSSKSSASSGKTSKSSKRRRND